MRPGLVQETCVTARESSSPALDAYDEISVFRDKHADVIWRNKEASPAELRALLADLDAGLAKLSTPVNTDLAEGNVYLRFRRVNFLIDKIIVLDRLEDPTAAIRAWHCDWQRQWRKHRSTLAIQPTRWRNGANLCETR
jgi:hypothetical protein